VIKTAAIVYFPGTGGNFLKCCLSLSPETVPYLWKHHNSYTDEEIIAFRSMSAQQRQQILDFSNIKDFDKFHAVYGQQPTIPNISWHYDNPLIDDYYKWAVVTEHLDSYIQNLPFFSKLFYVKLDFNRFGSWIENNANYFKTFSYVSNFLVNNDGTYQPTLQQQKQVDQITAHSITNVISMDEILEGTQGFIKQYVNACECLNITPVIDCATNFYKDWRRFRVDPFIL